MRNDRQAALFMITLSIIIQAIRLSGRSDSEWHRSPELIYDGSTIAKCRTKISDATKWDRYVSGRYTQIIITHTTFNDNVVFRPKSEPFPSPDTFGWARSDTG